MANHMLLTIASDDRFVQLLRWQLQDHEDGTTHMTVAGSIDEACSLLREVRPRLIVVEWSARMTLRRVESTPLDDHGSSRIASRFWSSPTAIASIRQRGSTAWA